MSDDVTNDDTTYCFLDTCIFLHFQMFDEVDWLTVLEAASVCLMVAPVVVRELNDHKDDSHNDRRQQRARDVIRKLEAVLPDSPARTGHVRDGVTIRDIAREPHPTWLELELDPQVQDDRLIGTMLEFRDQHLSGRVCVITDDMALRRKAKHHSLQAIDPSGKIDSLPFAASALEIENQKLKQQIQTMTHRAPELGFGFWENRALAIKVERARQPRREGAPTDEALALEVARLRAKHETAVEMGRGHVSDEEIDKYKAAFGRYIRQFMIAKKMLRSREYGPFCRVTFALHNAGSAAANAVDLGVYFPAGSFVVGEVDADKHDYGWDEVDIPDEPTAKWVLRPAPFDPYGIRNTSNLSALLLPRSELVPRPPKRRGPLYDFGGDRRFIGFEDPKTSQDSWWVMPTVIAYLPPDEKGGFAIEYSLRADELPSAVSGKLNVIWKQK